MKVRAVAYCLAVFIEIHREIGYFPAHPKTPTSSNSLSSSESMVRITRSKPRSTHTPPRG